MGKSRISIPSSYTLLNPRRLPGPLRPQLCTFTSPYCRRMSTSTCPLPSCSRPVVSHTKPSRNCLPRICIMRSWPTAFVKFQLSYATLRHCLGLTRPPCMLMDLNAHGLSGRRQYDLPPCCPLAPSRVCQTCVVIKSCHRPTST
jgi:hypothetical protein